MSGLMGFSTGAGACFKEARADANKWDSGVAAGMSSNIFLCSRGGGGGAGGAGGGRQTLSKPKGIEAGLLDSFALVNMKFLMKNAHSLLASISQSLPPTS
jgi:hypothetical protein